MRALLDINVLIALFDANHIFNDRAHMWLEGQSNSGIASCPLSENGLVRILSTPNYSRKIRLTPPEVIRRLRAFFETQDHCRIDDSISLTDATRFNATHLLGSKQITDIYLLGLATHHGLKLATFDGNILIQAVNGATTEHLEVIR